MAISKIKIGDTTHDISVDTENITGTLPLIHGGTGATTATAALTNLGITATASELNYVDGVTSNIQTQLNNKAASSHTHSYLPLSGGNLTGNLTGQYITGTWLQSTANNALSSAAPKICVQDDSGWIYTRTPSQIKSDIGAGNCSSIVKSNVSVATSAWVSSTTYSDYPYQASITVSGCTSNHVPEVVFSPTDTSSGIFAPVCSSTTNAVIIYATEKPSAAITVLTVECRKAL